MSKKALIIWGGWDGHHPKACADLFEAKLKTRGYDVTVSNTLDTLLNADLLKTIDLFVPIWTMGQISGEQSGAAGKAVAAGMGLGGFHGGMCDAFRNDCGWQFMTGGQFVAHPGGNMPEWTVDVVDPSNAIVKGIKPFKLTKTERYYMHVDPSNHVLADTAMPRVFIDDNIYGGTGAGDPAAGTFRMPVVWTRPHKKGKVFFASWGHSPTDFDVPEALEITLRGMEWATR